MKKKFLDFIIIGSGPSSIGAILASKKKNFLVVTGESNLKNKFKKDSIHKKIMYEENSSKKNFLSNVYTNKKNLLFSISKIGGFANYWGQGCEYVPYNKLYNKRLFKNEREYLSIIEKFNKFFKISKTNKSILINNLRYYPSPLLRNSPQKNNTELNSFRKAYFYLVKQKKFQTINSNVIRITKYKKYIKITLQNKKKFLAKKIFLSANTVGNSKILFESDKNIEKMSFYDDCPKQIYAISINHKFNNFIKQYYSIIVSNLNNYFISSYNLRRINLSFFLFYIFGVKFSLFEKYKSFFLGSINFFQYWSKKTLIKAILKRDMTYNLKKKKVFKINAKSLFKDNLIYPFKVNDTKFGEGFHFHNLQIKKNNKWLSLEKYLKGKYDNKVYCIDSSNETSINPGPFTITQMSIAYKKIHTILNNQKK
jgi:hypothetical protein